MPRHTVLVDRTCNEGAARSAIVEFAAGSQRSTRFASCRSRRALPCSRTTPRRAGQENNWILTRDGQPFFVMFCIYGRQKRAVDGSWVLNDIEQVK